MSQDAVTTGIASRTARSSVLMLIAKAVRHGYAFFVYYLLINLLTPSDFGLMKYITIVLAIVNMLVELGFSVAVVQKSSLSRDETSAAFTLTFFSGLIMYAAVYFGAPVISAWFRVPLLTDLIRVGCLALPLGGLSVVQRSVLQRKMQFKAIAAVEVIAALASSTLALVLAFSGYGVWSLVSSVLCFNAVSSLILILLCGFPKGNYFKLSAAKSLWVVGFSMVFQRVIDYITNSFDAIMIGRFFGEFAVGIYGLAFDIGMLPRVAVVAVFSQVLISAFSRVQQDKEKVSSGFQQLTIFISAISMPFFAAVFALPEEILNILGAFRHDTVWLGAAAPLRIMAVAGALYILSSYPGMIWISLGTVKLRMIWAVAMAVTMIAAVFLGVNFGLTGVCWALLIRAALIMPFVIAINRKLFAVSLVQYVKLLIPSFISGMVMLVVILTISKLIPGSSLNGSIMLFSVGSLFGITAYFLMYIVFWREQLIQLFRPLHSLFQKPAAVST